MAEKLSEWQIADCGFDERSARKLLESHDAGQYDEAAGWLSDAFCWSAAPWPDFGSTHSYWASAQAALRSATPQPGAMNIIRIWLGDPMAYGPEPVRPLKINRVPPIIPTLTEDQVATWLAARGMTMIDTKELAALKRNGTGGPPPIDGETLRRISRY